MHSPIVKHETIVLMNLNIYRSQGVGGKGPYTCSLNVGVILNIPPLLRIKIPPTCKSFLKGIFTNIRCPSNTIKEFLLLFYNTYIQVCIQICIMIGLRLYIAFSNLPTLKIQFHESCARIV
jgi:hypothetical protein